MPPMWVIGEAHPTSFHSSYLNATPSGSAFDFVNLNQSSGENPYVHVASVNAAAPSIRNPMNKICNALESCGKRLEDTR
ncbi:hypothetical protein NL676_000460 [Syzygium grande]|nr:hypothetical protein NL676_000460 [Syzygium grande]